MGLGFLVPAFLAGLAALLVPLFFHLRQREHQRPHRFPSLMFLRRIPIRTARRRRITDWLLLMLRAGVVALLAVAFARPFFARRVPIARAAPAHAVVLLLDRSLSMGHRDVWPAALDSARRIIAALGVGDRVAVVLFDEEALVAQPFTTDRAAALAAVEAARPGERGTRYVAALRAARQVLADAPGAGATVLVVTDLQRSGLANLAGLELPAGIEVRAVSVAAKDRANAAVVGVDVQRSRGGEGERSRLLVSARVSARELRAPRRARIALTLNGRAAGSREVTLPESGALSVAFDPVPLPAGRVRGTVDLDPDALAADDAFRFVVPAEAALRVLLAAPGDAAPEETLFLERALAIGAEPRLAVERRAAGSLDGRLLRGASLVILDDVAVPAGAAGAALDAWVQAGGGLVVAAGRRLAARPAPAAPAAPAAMLPGAVRGAVERLEDRGGTLGDVALEHPIFSPFKDGGGAALGAARFLRYARLVPAAGAEVLARFDDGQPALLEWIHGSGRVLLAAVPLDALAGDFPLQPAYLPFLRRLSLHAAGHQPPPLWRTTGETGIVPTGTRDPVVVTPAGDLLRPASDSGPCVVVLGTAGFYAVHQGRAAGEPMEVIAANPPAAESDLTPADPRELLLGVRRSDSTLATASGPATSAEREKGQRLWRLLLVGAAVLLLAETIVANRGWRATGSNLAAAPPKGAAHDPAD